MFVTCSSTAMASRSLVLSLLVLMTAPTADGQALCNIANRLSQFFPRAFSNRVTTLCRAWTSEAITTHSFSGVGIQSSVRGGVGENLLPVYSQTPQVCRSPVVRKEVRTLTDAEWRRFVNAVIQLKRTPQGQSNAYDEFAIIHNATTAPQAHFTAMFLPWHREYLFRFENALRQIDCSIAIPYWDVTLEAPLPEGRDSILWTDYYYGSSVGPVTSGPFRNWRIPPEVVQWVADTGVERGENFNYGDILYRTLGTQGGGFFPNDIVQEIFRARRFRELTWAVDPLLEAVHAGPHVFTGGHHAILLSASFDPIFWIYHSFIDCLWEEWRQNYQQADPETDYVTLDSELASDQELAPYARANAPMLPFGPPLRNSDGLRNIYTQRYYRCARRPTCSANSLDCGSPYLFCDTRSYSCVSQIQQGGNCTGFEGNSRACFSSVCCNGVCSASCGPPPREPVPAPGTDCDRTGCKINARDDYNRQRTSNNRPPTFMDHIRRLDNFVSNLERRIF
ncbi:putative tyrosinase-like protein tyr-3 [Lingula anatina]|uniref:Tyrosinase-like protein tyr-3 n=1 Tax=Lingula anatina TaxID=7574 RepID=A0A2R2MNF5_LINAN|nr:putative tyrosinase-like protein tyr-3 [Lingula anatina]|eukprot:XP_023931758.1 putative tyrosinase-like protein tyr-3 [Lingula anatina]